PRRLSRSDVELRQIVREEVRRYREAERRIASHPNAYSHGRMVPVEEETRSTRLPLRGRSEGRGSPQTQSSSSRSSTSTRARFSTERHATRRPDSPEAASRRDIAGRYSSEQQPEPSRKRAATNVTTGHGRGPQWQRTAPEKRIIEPFHQPPPRYVTDRTHVTRQRGADPDRERVITERLITTFRRPLDDSAPHQDHSSISTEPIRGCDAQLQANRPRSIMRSPSESHRRGSSDERQRRKSRPSEENTAADVEGPKVQFTAGTRRTDSDKVHNRRMSLSDDNVAYRNRVRSAGLDGHFSQGYHANDLHELDEYYLHHPPVGYHLAEIVTLSALAAPRHNTAQESRFRPPSPPRRRHRSLSNASSESHSRERPRTYVPASQSPSPTSSMCVNTLSRTPSPLPPNPFDHQVYNHNDAPRHDRPPRTDRPAVASGPRAAEGAETFVDVREVRESNVDGDVERAIEIAETVRTPEGKRG
ncbi:hypothetical protein LTR16_001362, partial [Cryomyces antarcticus]